MIATRRTPARPMRAGGRSRRLSEQFFRAISRPTRKRELGTWSEAAFRRAMHEGVDRKGRQLYPAFPYDHFTKATNDDIHALYVFLMSQPPVHKAIPANELSFPFNFRPILAGWKVLVSSGNSTCNKMTAKVPRGIAADIWSKGSGIAAPVIRLEIFWARKRRTAPTPAALPKDGTRHL